MVENRHSAMEANKIAKLIDIDISYLTPESHLYSTFCKLISKA